ncbi:unnamed protein product, partial [Urochloa humidicola]
AATSTHDGRRCPDPAGAQPSLKDVSATTPSTPPSVLSTTTTTLSATKPYLAAASLCHYNGSFSPPPRRPLSATSPSPQMKDLPVSTPSPTARSSPPPESARLRED